MKNLYVFLEMLSKQQRQYIKRIANISNKSIKKTAETFEKWFGRNQFNRINKIAFMTFNKGFAFYKELETDLTISDKSVIVYLDSIGWQAVYPITNKKGSTTNDCSSYILGIANKKDNHNQSMKIGKILSRNLKKSITEKNEEDINKLKNLSDYFQSSSVRDEYSKFFKNDYVIYISWHPYIIAQMSTNKNWTSCMRLPTSRFLKTNPGYTPDDDLEDYDNDDYDELVEKRENLSTRIVQYKVAIRESQENFNKTKDKEEQERIQDLSKTLNRMEVSLKETERLIDLLDQGANNVEAGGEMHKHIPTDIYHNSLIAFLVPENDKFNIDKAIARILMKRFYVLDDDGKQTSKSYLIPSKTYGKIIGGFKTQVLDFLIEHQGKIPKDTKLQIGALTEAGYTDDLPETLSSQNFTKILSSLFE